MSLIAGVYFSQTSVIYFCQGFGCCPYYRGVHNSEVSARRELTVIIISSDALPLSYRRLETGVLGNDLTNQI